MNNVPSINLESVFQQQVEQTKQRIDSIASSNRMAGLLHQNFKDNIMNGTYDASTLIYEADGNKDNIISVDELNNLIFKLTKEHPPAWVSELLFRFMGKEPNQGIMLTEYYAFLSTLGVAPPDSFLKKDESPEENIEVAPEPEIHLDVSTHEDGNLIKIVLLKPPYQKDAWIGFFEIGSNKPFNDSQYFFSDLASEGKVELFVENIYPNGIYLVQLFEDDSENPSVRDSVSVQLERTEKIEEYVDEDAQDNADEELLVEIEEDVVEYNVSNLNDFLMDLERCRLSRDYAEKIHQTNAQFSIQFTPMSRQTTLLSEKGYKGGTSFIGTEDHGLHEIEIQFPIGEEFAVMLNKSLSVTCTPISWSLARHRLILKKI
ncbi:MAG: hypothetical protein O2866_02865 [archaeon]|nr:hypothetical protein [archaeon]MDA0842995.1 hypothetical protein [archaeon]MDA1167807.1 hypothetical protein [archaeon]